MYRLNICCVQRVEVLCGGHTINDVQGSSTVYSTHTTYTNRSTAATWGCIGHNVHARQLTLHGVQHVGIALALGPFHVHHGNCTCQVGFTLYLIASDHNFGQLGSVVLHHDFHTVLGGYFLFLIADVADDKDGSFCDINCKVTV